MNQENKGAVSPTVIIIVAAGQDGAIGRAGELIWHLPGDLRRFKQLTMGHPVIMGRKTWESLPKRPLPGRRNIVVTRREGYEAPGAEVVSSPEEALAAAGDDAFVTGGAEIYKALMPYATRIYLTEVEATCEDADARLELPADTKAWRVVEETPWTTTDEGVRFRYVTSMRNENQEAV